MVRCIIRSTWFNSRIGLFFTKKIFTKQLEENPPINEKMIEAMMSSMGRKPSQKQVRQVMQQMNKFR